MRRFLLLAGASLFLSIGAAAQGPAGVGGSAGGGRTTVGPLGDYGPTQWELAIGYQYNRINLTGSPFNSNGVNASVARYFGNWFGLEAQVGAGFGNTGTATVPPSLTMKSVFAGGGPRLAYRGHGRIEPWVHGTVGLEYFRFTQTVGISGSNTSLAWSGGGGVDFHLNPRVAVRVGADALWTRFSGGDQRNFQAVAGLVFDF